jgi:hypothetical protein
MDGWSEKLKDSTSEFEAMDFLISGAVSASLSASPSAIICVVVCLPAFVP